MKTARVTRSGQLSIPASIRKRWATSRVVLDDQGDRLVVTPLPEDPIAAVRGILKGKIGSTSELRAVARRDESSRTR